MPPSGQNLLLSPAELAYLHSSLLLDPPVRPDGRSPTEFRPIIAEADILPGANGSARMCFADGTEAVVGVKANVDMSTWKPGQHGLDPPGEVVGENAWVETSIEIAGCRDDDPLLVFLAAMLTEALLADGQLPDRLFINHRFHWKLYIDILLLSPPLSYPLPLISLTTHLALLSARLPRLKSERDEDPLFDDDWAASTPLYPRISTASRPPITLLVVAVGPNIIFDPSKEELAVAEAVVALSVASDDQASTKTGPLRLLAVRTIDPPSRLTPPGVPNSLNTATGGVAPTSTSDAIALREAMQTPGVWSPPRGGVKRSLLAHVTKLAMQEHGVAAEVLAALEPLVNES